MRREAGGARHEASVWPDLVVVHGHASRESTTRIVQCHSDAVGRRHVGPCQEERRLVVAEAVDVLEVETMALAYGAHESELAPETCATCISHRHMSDVMKDY